MFKTIALAAVVLTGTALELTPDNWEEETAGKTVSTFQKNFNHLMLPCAFTFLIVK